MLFAYTMKGWGLPFAGDPLNHSALLSPEQIDALRTQLCVPADDDWACFPRRLARGQAVSRRRPPGCTRTARARQLPRLPVRPSDVPGVAAQPRAASISTQEVFGNALVELARLGGPLAERIVTASPDVTISTNLGGWVNRTGVWAENPWQAPATAVPRLLRWEPGPGGQHIELGISEMNLFMLLGQLGLSHELNGELLLPVGTVYDPFVCRGLDALIYSVYSGSKFVFAGTPAGVTLSPEGGAHQSAITASIGLELPNLRLYEPCFARETEWCLLDGLRQCLDREHGVEHLLAAEHARGRPAAVRSRAGAPGRSRAAPPGAARRLSLLEPTRPGRPAPRVVLAAAGPILPEVLAAAAELADEGVAATVLNITSADRLYAEWQASRLGGIRSASMPTQAAHLQRSAPTRGAQRAAGHRARRRQPRPGLPGRRLRPAHGPAGHGPLRPVRRSAQPLRLRRHRRRAHRQRGARSYW